MDIPKGHLSNLESCTARKIRGRVCGIFDRAPISNNGGAIKARSAETDV